MLSVIRSFKHSGLEKFFRKGSQAGIRPVHTDKLRLQLEALNNAVKPADMSAPEWDLRPSTGKLVEGWSVLVGDDWRMTFVFDGSDATVIDYRIHQ